MVSASEAFQEYIKGLEGVVKNNQPDQKASVEKLTDALEENLTELTQNAVPDTTPRLPIPFLWIRPRHPSKMYAENQDFIQLGGMLNGMVVPRLLKILAGFHGVYLSNATLYNVVMSVLEGESFGMNEEDLTVFFTELVKKFDEVSRSDYVTDNRQIFDIDDFSYLWDALRARMAVGSNGEQQPLGAPLRDAIADSIERFTGASWAWKEEGEDFVKALREIPAV